MGIVIKTGDNTFIGQIATASTGEKKKSTLELEVQKFVRFITILAVSMGVVFFVIGVAISTEEVGKRIISNSTFSLITFSYFNQHHWCDCC